jgi:hypothetical protein
LSLTPESRFSVPSSRASIDPREKSAWIELLWTFLGVSGGLGGGVACLDCFHSALTGEGTDSTFVMESDGAAAQWLHLAGSAVGIAASYFFLWKRKRAVAREGAQYLSAKPHQSPEEIVEGYSRRFGKACRQKFALDFDSGFTHCNHGSYGVCPSIVLEAARAAMLRIEAFPDHFMRRQAMRDYKAVCEEVGAFVGTPAKSCVLVENG